MPPVLSPSTTHHDRKVINYARISVTQKPQIELMPVVFLGCNSVRRVSVKAEMGGKHVGK